MAFHSSWIRWTTNPEPSVGFQHAIVLCTVARALCVSLFPLPVPSYLGVLYKIKHFTTSHLAHLGGLVMKGREEAFQQPAHRLHHADRRDWHERLKLAFLQHLQYVWDVPAQSKQLHTQPINARYSQHLQNKNSAPCHLWHNNNSSVCSALFLFLTC